LRVCGTAIHRCQCVCLCQRSSVIAVVREALAPGYPSGVCLPLHFGYVHFCSCTSSCSELLLVNLCSWRSPVIHRCWDPSLFVVVSVVPGGSAEFSSCAPVHMPVSSFFHAMGVLPGTCSRASVRGRHSRALPRGVSALGPGQAFSSHW